VGRVAVDFWRWPRRERSADIRSDLGQASNAGQHQKRRNPPGRKAEGAAGRAARSLQPALGMRLTRSLPSTLLPLRATHSSISTVS